METVGALAVHVLPLGVAVQRRCAGQSVTVSNGQ
eukprot:COSAG01_NODE_1724_length_9382_cov_6.435743_3_plen_34_part_00